MDIPKLYRSTYDKAKTGKSRAAAIKAKCLDCCGYQKVEVRRCPAKECPLWPYRPYQQRSTKKSPTTGDFTDSEANHGTDPRNEK